MSESKTNQEWPGIYPEHAGWYQFAMIKKDGTFFDPACVYGGPGNRFVLGFGREILEFSETKPEQWGPEIQMARP